MKKAAAWIRWRFVLLLAALTPTCREVVRQASLDHEQPIGHWTRLRLRVHLRICAGCERYLRQLDVLHQAAARAGDTIHDTGRAVHLAAEAKERIKQRLRCERPGN